MLENFSDNIHQDQKIAILATALVQNTERVPAAQRFPYLLDNLGAVTETLRQGYRLFASSFSYSKIRSEVEAARADYIAKIHKTLIDIQGQLLGIPVATIIVVSQLKTSQACGVEFWTNVAVLAGAWVFLVLLLVAIVNQWMTLAAIGDDIRGQQKRLKNEYAAISEQFVSIFNGLVKRVNWHRSVIIVVSIIAIAGTLFASYAFTRLTAEPMTCLMTPSAAIVTPTEPVLPAPTQNAPQPPKATQAEPAIKGIK